MTKIRTFTKTTAAALSVFCGISFAQTSKIAVYVSEHSMEKEVLEMTTLSTLVNSGRYEVVERSGIIDEELSKQASGAVDDDQLTRFGRQAGAQYICVSDMVSPFGTRQVPRQVPYQVDVGNNRTETRYRTEYDSYVDYQVSARIIDVETAEVVALGVVTKPNISQDVPNVTNSAVREMLNTVQDKTAPNMSKIAVYVQGSSDQNVRNAVYTYVLNALFTRSRYNGDFKVVERSEAFTRQIDREHGKQQSGAVDNAQISRMGKQYGIEKILIANVAASSDVYNISARLINVETASVVKASAAIYKYSGTMDMEVLRRNSVQIVEDMIPRKITQAEIDEEQAFLKAEAEEEQAFLKAKEEAERTGWYAAPLFSIGGAVMLNSIDSLYSGGGFFFSLGSEFFKGNVDFIRFGLNADLGVIFTDHDAVEKIHPDIVSDSTLPAGLLKISAFARLYPVDALYLSGAAGVGYYGAYDSKTKSDEKISGSGTWAPVLSVGGGLVFGNFFLDARYNMLPSNSDANYVTVNIGFTGRTLMNGPKERQKKHKHKELI